MNDVDVDFSGLSKMAGKVKELCMLILMHVKSEATRNKRRLIVLNKVKIVLSGIKEHRGVLIAMMLMSGIKKTKHFT